MRRGGREEYRQEMRYCAQMFFRRLLFAALLTRLAIPPSPLTGGAAAAQNPLRAMLDQVIRSAGGRGLQRFHAMAWHGVADVAAGPRTVRIEGDWNVEPPDRARVETWEIDKGRASARTMILEPGHDRMRRDGQEQPLPPEIAANERDQFYVYHLMRLITLNDADVRLTLLPAGGDGHDGIRVQRAGRRDADLYFDRAYRLVRLVTTIADPASKRDVREELRFTGSIASNGVRWPRRIQILQDGAPFFDLEIARFTAMTTLDASNQQR